ncbi:MAG: MFS transporter [Desulfobacteraceae bacterium]|jgi:PAT family beta-lactamase induction signal transducer AmpG
MNHSQTITRPWKDAVAPFFHPRVLAMLFLGFSAGLPTPLIFSSLSLWLREAGIERSAVTFFSWASLGYSFKFIWAPLIDQLPIPWLTKTLGRRRSWMLLSQIAVIISIGFMAMVDPSPSFGERSLILMALGAVALGFFSATQDIVIDAYRIEVDVLELQAMMASAYVAGYRVAMIVAGAGALYLAEILGSSKGIYSYSAWKTTYLIMAGIMLVGVFTTLVIGEPEQNNNRGQREDTVYNLRFLGLFLFAVTGFFLMFTYSNNIIMGLEPGIKMITGNVELTGFILETLRLVLSVAVAFIVSEICIRTGLAQREMVIRTYVEPIRNFFQRYGIKLALLLLCLVGLYKISDTVMGVIANVFYQDMGFSKTEIAAASKTFGVVMTIVGGIVGGILTLRYGVIRILFLGGLLASATNLLFMVLAVHVHHMPLLYCVISVDSFAGGIAATAFIAFLSSLTNISFTAMQYAIFSSLMTLIPKIIGGYAGTMVDKMGYPVFFLITAILGLPVLVLVWLAGKHLGLKHQ